MQKSCSDVCERVHQSLTERGFDIDSDSEDHSDMLEALDEVELVDSDSLKVLKSYVERLHEANMEILGKDYPIDGVDGADTVEDVGNALERL